VARETTGSVKSQKKKKWIWISDETYATKREAKGKDKKLYEELKAEVQRKLRVDKQLKHHEETREQEMQGTMPGARRRGRPRTAWMDNIKTWTRLSVEESIRMTEDRDKWRKYVRGVANPGSRTAKEQNRRSLTGLSS